GLDGFPAPPPCVDLDPELREAFLAEATDLFERIQTLVLSLDQQADPAETLHELGRCYHTLKGAAGSVGLLELASLVHSLEESLDGPPAIVTPGMVALFHGGLRSLEGILEAVRKGPGAPAPARAPAMLAAQDASASPGPSPSTAAPRGRVENPVEEAVPALGAAAEGPL